MAKIIQRTGFLFGTVVILLCFYCDCRPLDGYAFPVYTTKSCPKNLTEWQERSFALTCNQTNAYMCVPNENFTELLEFCYNGPQIRIVKGLCMFLYKRHSTLDAYECSHFTEGCPSSNYRSQDVNVYQNCVNILNGCFLAEPTCGRVTTMQNLVNRTKPMYIDTTKISLYKHYEKADWILIITLLGTTALLFMTICILSVWIKIKPCHPATPTNIEQTVSLLNISEETQVKELNTPSQTDTAKNIKGYHKEIQNWSLIHALNNACYNGQNVIVERLLKKGANINSSDENGNTPLCAASFEGQNSTIILLLKNGADINLCNNNGGSALYIACEYGHDSTVKLLLNNGADINVCLDGGFSPLYKACCEGFDKFVILLLNNCAAINLCNNNGGSPLYIACENGHEEIVQRLLNNGADVNLCTDSGASPLCISCQNGHDSAVELLLNNGDEVNLCNN